MADVDLSYSTQGLDLAAGDTVEVGRLDGAGLMGDQPFELVITPVWPGPVWWRVVRSGTNAYIEFRGSEPGVVGSTGISVSEEWESVVLGEWSAFTGVGQLQISLRYEVG